MVQLQGQSTKKDTKTQQYVYVSENNELFTTDPKSRYTSFGELSTAFRTSSFNLKPTWGVSAIRNTVTETGTGASVAETNGEIRLQTGTAASNEASIRTKERGQYQAGTEGEAGMGVRVPTNPTGTQYAEWGYFDDNNGFGYGVDSTGIYVFRRDGGVDNVTRQADWNVDPADGTGDSEFTLDLSDGNIFQINFVWYGYGSISYYINVRKSSSMRTERILVHTEEVTEQTSIVDPNQPLTISAFNGDTSDTNFNVYVGGRQFSVVDGNSSPQLRNTPIEIDVGIVSSTTYTPVASIRKKATFNGRENSVNTFLNDIQISTDNPIAIKLDYGGSSSGGTWATPDDLDASETAMEVNTSITGATAFHALDKVLAGGDKNTKLSETRRERIVFGQSDEIVVYIKQTNSTNANVSLILDIEEEW